MKKTLLFAFCFLAILLSLCSCSTLSNRDESISADNDADADLNDILSSFADDTSFVNEDVRDDDEDLEVIENAAPVSSNVAQNKPTVAPKAAVYNYSIPFSDNTPEAKAAFVNKWDTDIKDFARDTTEYWLAFGTDNSAVTSSKYRYSCIVALLTRACYQRMRGYIPDEIKIKGYCNKEIEQIKSQAYLQLRNRESEDPSPTTPAANTDQPSEFDREALGTRAMKGYLENIFFSIGQATACEQFLQDILVPPMSTFPGEDKFSVSCDLGTCNGLFVKFNNLASGDRNGKLMKCNLESTISFNQETTSQYCNRFSYECLMSARAYIDARSSVYFHTDPIAGNTNGRCLNSAQRSQQSTQKQSLYVFQEVEDTINFCPVSACQAGFDAMTKLFPVMCPGNMPIAADASDLELDMQDSGCINCQNPGCKEFSRNLARR